MLIDSHCHLHDLEFFTSLEQEAALARALERGVAKIICIGTDPEDSLAARDFAARHENVYWTYGVHPEEASRGSEPIFSSAGLDFSSTSYAGQPGEPPLRGGSPGGVRNIRIENSNQSFMHLKKQVSDHRLVAIGEVGLDYHSEGYDRAAQIRLFEEMLQLAQDLGLPMSFHVRNAFSDFFPVVANFPGTRGVVHCFTDSKKNLKRILDETEFYVGVDGVATYSTIATPPLERILIETDAPFLAPVPHRGEKNEPSFVVDTAAWLAGQLGVSLEEVEQKTTQNALDLFHL